MNNAFQQTSLSLQSVILFESGGHWYGVGLAHVREIIPIMPIVPLPHVPSSIAGIINWHGNIVSVIDLGALFENVSSHQNKGKNLVIVEWMNKTTAFVSDGRVEVGTIPFKGFSVKVLDVKEVLEQSVKAKIL